MSIPDVRATRPHSIGPEPLEAGSATDGGDTDADLPIAAGGPCTSDGDRACATGDPAQLLVCSKNATWDANGRCNGATPVCVAGACVACNDGALGCDGDSVTSCVEGAWVTGDACTATTPLCQGGTCVDRCTDGTTSCSGAQTRSCVGGAWVDGKVCAGDRPNCIDGSCVGSCTGTETSCDDDTPLACVNGEWTAASPCSGAAPACYQGACVLCAPGALSCDGDTVRECSSDKQWVVTSVCQDPTRACYNGACSECSSTNTTGCPTNQPACLDGACVPCSPGTLSCDGETPRSCDATGNWVDGAVCTRDCAKGICETCEDKIQNGDETDTDCGGATCPQCQVGQTCKAGTDCDTGTCSGVACTLPSSGCPPVPPDTTAACKDGTSCTYGSDVRPACRTQFTCTMGTWSVVTPSCAPATPCSTESPAPITGGACGVANDFCVNADQTNCGCTFCQAPPCAGTDTWKCTTAEPTSCPPVLPNLGQACTGTASCTYGNCSSPNAATIAQCTKGSWTWTTAICEQ